MKRGLVFTLCAAAVAIVGSRPAYSQSTQPVTLSLDIFYSDAAGSSGGAWQLLAESTGNQGIAGVATQLTGITTGSSVFMAPQPAFQLNYLDDNGTPETSDDVLKPWNTDIDGDTATAEMVIAQVPLPGEPLLYGAGVTTNNPDELGVSVDTSGNNMDSAVLLAIGTFAAGQTPTIVNAETDANVYTAQGTGGNPPAIGTILQATVTTQVRNNIGSIPGDANLDKTVSVGDLAILGTFFNESNATWQQGDFSGDNQVTVGDLAILGTFFNQSAAAPAVAAIPEPSSIALIGVAGFGIARLRRRR